MSELARDLLPIPSDDDRDQRVFLRGVSWAQYEMIRQIRGERRLPRLTYQDGALELMSPGRSHERIAAVWARLLELWSMEVNVALNAYGAWTLTSEEKKRGVEADRCYTVGTSDADKPVPDLALEVVWSHDDPDKLTIYAGLGVREVWVWKASRITVHVLRGDAYVTATRSEVLPAIDLALLGRYVERLDLHEALREYRDALRATLPPSPR